MVWFVSGIAMVFAGGMPRLPAETRLARMPPLDLAHVRLTPGEAASRVGATPDPGRVVLLTILDRPAYRFGTTEPVTVFADTGDVLDTIDDEHSLAIASRFTRLPVAALTHVRLLETPDQWTIGQRRELPLHKIAVNDPAGTELYVSEPLGEVVMQTTRRSRALAWVAAIPHWLYFAPLRLNARLWTAVVLWTSGLGIVAALAGLALGVIQRRVRYAGWMRWHYVTGIVFGVFTLSWVFSGFLSMQPFDWLSHESSVQSAALALAGGPLDLGVFPAIDPAAWTRILPEVEAKEIEFRRIQDEAYYLIRRSADASGPSMPIMVAANPLRIRREPFPTESIVARLTRGSPGIPISDTQLLAEYDSYYRDRDLEAPLPVLRVKLGDPDKTWVYVDRMSQVVAQFSRGQRIERWLYHGLHSLDFSFWYDRRLLWEAGMVALCGGGAVLSVVGVVIGLKRIRRKSRWAWMYPLSR